MKKIALTLLVLSLVLPAAPALAATWTDDFNDNTLDPAKWFPPYSEDTSGNIEETNQHIEYTSLGDAGAGSGNENFASIGSQATLPVATPWTASVDMHLGDYGSPGDSDYWYGVALVVFSSGAGGTHNAFCFERVRQNDSSLLANAWDACKETGDNEVYGNRIAAGSDDGRITASWDGQYFNAWFNESAGPVPLAIDVDIADWGAVTQLNVAIDGWDEGCDWVLNDGSQMTLDNFELIIVPEPASATLLLTLALPALIRRRRRR